MYRFNPRQGIGTLVNHIGSQPYADNSHIIPIYQTSTFRFEDTEDGAAIFRGEKPAGYYYTRIANPNLNQLADKIAILEGIDLLRARAGEPPESVVAGRVFGSGMAAITAAVLARVQPGQTVIAQEALYSATSNFLREYAPRFGFRAVFLPDRAPQAWEDAFQANPGAVLAYAESPINPVMGLTDLAAVAEIAHRYGAWLLVDNTFASPYCQRPLSLGADVVLHSTTKYLSGHGLVIGGAVVSPHLEYVKGPLQGMLNTLGGCASPFDAWLADNGLRTFEVRMQRHCENTLKIAEFLEAHPAVARVYYPGLPSHPEHELARRQMHGYGGMMSFELKGGLSAGAALMNAVQVSTLAVSLGNVDSLIQHPASMTHSNIPAELRRKMGISDGLVRFSVGIENIEDLMDDLDRALSICQ